MNIEERLEALASLQHAFTTFDKDLFREAARLIRECRDAGFIGEHGKVASVEDAYAEHDKARRASIVNRVMNQHVCGSNGFRDVEGAVCDACVREAAAAAKEAK